MSSPFMKVWNLVRNSADMRKYSWWYWMCFCNQKAFRTQFRLQMKLQNQWWNEPQTHNSVWVCMIYDFVDYVVMIRWLWGGISEKQASMISWNLCECVFSHYLAAPWHHPHLPSRLQWLRGPSQAWSQTSPETTWLPEVSCDSVAAVLVLYP